MDAAGRRETTSGIRSQFDFLRAVTNSLGEGVYAVDREGRLTFLNTTGERLLGWTEGELLGVEMHPRVHFEHPDGTPLTAHRCPLLNVLRSHTPHSGEDDVFVRRDGSRFPVSYIASPLIEHGRLIGAAVSFRDITERKRTEAAQREARAQAEALAVELARQASDLDTVIAAIPDALIVYDVTGTIVRTNARGTALLEAAGGEATTVYDVGFAELDGTPLPVDRSPLASALAGQITTDARLRIGRPGGTPAYADRDIYLLVSAAPLRNAAGEVTGAVCVASDISELHRLERQKDEFLSVASHELKTPLTSLKILAQLTRRRLSRGGATEADQLEGMERAIVRMERLVNDLLEVSRMGEGKLQFAVEPADLGVICRQVVEEQVAATNRTVELTLPDEPLVAPVDAGRIAQVLTNLVSNALKYSPAQRSVSVAVRVEQVDGRAEAHIAVRDQGGGIPQEALPHLFERFYRAPGVQVQSGSGVGLGLGLYISREIMERHGGRIWVESTPGEGSCFHIALPFAPTH